MHILGLPPMEKIFDVQAHSIEEYELKFVRYNPYARQLSTGDFQSSNLIFLDECSFGIRCVSQDIEEYACVPKNETLFGLPLTPWPINFCNHILTTGLAAYVKGGELYRHLPKGTVTLPIALLDQTIEKYYPEEFCEYQKIITPPSGYILLDTNIVASMVNRISFFFNLYSKHKSIPSQAEIDIQDYILCTMMQLIFMNSKNKTRINDHKRWVKKAIDLVKGNSNHHYSVSNLASACGISPRALQASFKKHLGITPKKYLTYSRLKNIRHRILMDHQPQISNIAAEHGVVHFGNFSKEYHLLYGEKPSDTLKNNILN